MILLDAPEFPLIEIDQSSTSFSLTFVSRLVVLVIATSVIIAAGNSLVAIPCVSTIWRGLCPGLLVASLQINFLLEIWNSPPESISESKWKVYVVVYIFGIWVFVVGALTYSLEKGCPTPSTA